MDNAKNWTCSIASANQDGGGERPTSQSLRVPGGREHRVQCDLHQHHPAQWPQAEWKPHKVSVDR